MADPHDPTDAPGGLADLLGIEPVQLANADVTLVVDDGLTVGLHLDVALVNGTVRKVPLPDRFLDPSARTVDVVALVEWLDIDTSVVAARVPLHPAVNGVGWRLDRPDDIGAHAVKDLPLGRLPDSVRGDALLTSEIGPPDRPLPDPDTWPDTLDQWLADIDARLRWDGDLTAADMRVLYGGIDDLDVDDPGYWDPMTDSVDPTMEEAFRIRGVPGAFPPPEPLPEVSGTQDRDQPADDDLPVIPVDNRMAIEADPDPAGLRGCLSSVLTRWVLVGGLLALGIIALALVLSRDGSGDTEPVDDAAPQEDTDAAADEPAEDEETAEEVLQRATQELLDGRTAEIEQTFTVAGVGAADQTVTATGVVDFGAGDSQSTVNAQGTTFDTYLAEDLYAFDPGSGWVETEPNELNDNEDAEQVGLTAFGLGEALSPVAAVHVAAAAQDIEEGADGTYEAVTTLPVQGAGATLIDNLARALYGRGQAELPGVGIRLRLIPGADSTTITLTAALEDSIEFLDDDPDAESLRGVTLTNETRFSAIGMPVTLNGRNAQRLALDDLITQL